MDEIDVKILKILWKDGRTPIYQIARDIGLSTSAVDKRIKNMIKRGELLGFSVLLNPDKILNSVVVAIRTKKRRGEIMDKFSKIKGAMHIIACLGGRYYGEFWYDDEFELEEKLELLRELTGLYRMDVYKHRKVQSEKIDKLDWRIISEMKNDSRIPFSELSKHINISSKTIAKRWKKLTENDICKSYPIINRPLSQDIFWFSLFIEVENLSIESRIRRINNLWRTSLFSEPKMVYGVFYANSVYSIDETMEAVMGIPGVKKVHYEIIVKERFYPDYIDYVRHKMERLME